MKIRQIQEALQQWKRKITVKRTLTVLLICFLCILPTVLSSLYVQYYEYSAQTNLFSVTLYDEEYTELFSEEGTPENATPGSIIDLFYQLNTKKTPLFKPFGDPATDDFIIAKIAFNGTTTELKCYFSRFQPQGYCIDQTGKSYTIPSSINDLFLLSAYGEFFYTNATAPTLTTIDGDQITPFFTDWHYQAIDNAYLLARRNKTEEAGILYEITGTIGLQFDPPPDSCTVSIYSNGVQIERCTLDELPSVSVDKERRLTLDMHAEWLSSEELDYYGSIHYNFDVQIRSPSSFAISKNSVTAGEFILFSCTNIKNPEKINLILGEKKITPIFLQEDSVVYGFLPIPQNEAPTETTLQISYGASAEIFPLLIEAPNKTTLTKPEWSSTQPLTSLEPLRTRLSSLPTQKNEPIYFRGNFLNPQKEGFSIEYTHGTTVRYGEENRSLLTYGTEFVQSQANAAPVNVWNHGTVIYTGKNAALGTIVIVEHGGGLRTIYGALSNVNVEVGEIVQKGQTIGKTSTATRSGKNGFIALCAVGATVIDPTCLAGKTISFPKK